MAIDDDDLFIEEDLDESPLSAPSHRQRSWKIAIVDDDDDVHKTTCFALQYTQILNRPLEFIHTYSKEETRRVFATESDIAVVLLDVVMETVHAGLELVSYIRDELRWHDTRIILRTGQPGYAPEEDAIRDYDINDYKTKTELTRTKLYTAVTSAIRSYEQICSISASRRGLETIINASTELMATHGLNNFASGVLSQITALLALTTEGFICARQTPLGKDTDTEELHIIATTPQFSALLNQSLPTANNPAMLSVIGRSLSERKSIFDPTATAIYFNNVAKKEFTLYLDTGLHLNEMDKRLLDVFSGNVSVGLDNIVLNSRLHNYAFYDLLTGLSNRLKLLQTLNETLESHLKTKSALSLIDIDHFAETNDALGHQFGDLLLSSVA